ncbi:MAG: M48 family metalloprotease [Solirubrobacterales bacterium]|nr:M48 family metalloprotease [Solirubrobacterales bacterium]
MRRSLRLPIVLVAALVVAEAGVLILRPELPPAPAVDPQSYFSSDQIADAEDYRSAQLAFYGLRLALEIGTLAILAARLPRRLTRPTRHPVLLGAAAGAGLSLLLGLVTLPVRVASREQAKEVGLVTQDWLGYAFDVVRSEAIGALIAAVGAALLILALRRLGSHWWVAGAAAIVAYGAALTFLAPVVTEPLFNDFEPLPAGALRSEVLVLAERADVDVGEVYVVDASRRTRSANAYVAGLGATKRVVLYDTLLRDFRPDEVRLIVAHELGHVRHRDLPNGLLYVALVAPVGMLAAALLAERITPRGARRGPAAVPAVALAAVLVATPISMISNQLSRAVERRADAYSLELTGDPESLIAMQRRLSIRNLSDPSPPAWVTFLLSTHPPAAERIARAEAAR